ncbi:MAG: hypothetical protein P4L53_01805 [Candidatus Obscuribacterales bacterium]|nr:hypothetical protein [Candidatus Obscuribacterales bacterium]
MKRQAMHAAVLIIFAVGLCGLQPAQAEPENVLNIGSKASAGEINVPLHPVENYNFKPKAEIFDQRKKYVEMSPELVPGPYKPNDAVFGAVEDKRPWWGLQGSAVYGAGEKSIEGPAEESRFIANPLLLVGADAASANNFQKNLVTPSDLNDPDFPYTWKPLSLTWWANRSCARVIYNVSKFNDDLYRFRTKLVKPLIYPAFSLVAYNARDFGFNYIWLAPEKSINVENYAKPAAEAVRINQMLHCGGTCGYPGGCNNMSPRNIAIDRIKYSKLPARAYVKLWRAKPTKVTDDADMVFLIDLK